MRHCIRHTRCWLNNNAYLLRPMTDPMCCCREPYGASTDDVIAHVEAELASHGHAAAEHALFHGCHASILTVSQDVDEGSSSTAYGRLFSSTAKVLAASADTAQILMQARQTRLKLQVVPG